MFDAAQIEIGKFLPLREDQQRVGAFHGSISIGGIFNSAAQNLPRPIHCGRIKSCYMALFFKQLLDHIDRRRFAHIVRAILEGQSKHGQFFTFNCSQRAADLADKPYTLLVVDSFDFIEQRKFESEFVRHRAKCGHVFGET